MLNSLEANSFIIIVSLAFMTLAIVLVFLALKSAFEDNRKIRDRLMRRPEKDMSGSILRDTKSLENFGSHLTLPNAEEMTRIRFQLARAGYYSRASVKIYYAIRLICLIAPQFLALLFWGAISSQFDVGGAVILICILTLCGLFGPPLFIRFRQGKRTQQVKNGFPDMMDLLVACIEAGLALNAALLRVSDEIGSRYPVLKINLDLLNLELRAGRDRHAGMSNFADRVNLAEARALAVMLRQSEEMGSSLGVALRTFADDMRMKRMMKAEEKAMALSAKLTVPLIIFIFPTIMIMLLLPAGVRLAEGFYS